MEEMKGNEGARIAAAAAILDRGWGKPMVYVPIPTPPAKIELNFGFKKERPGSGAAGTARRYPAADRGHRSGRLRGYPFLAGGS